MSGSAAPATSRFTVGMTCEGCAGAIKRVLGKVEGVVSVTTDVAAKTVVVVGSTQQTLLDALKKWSEVSGKSVAIAQ